MNVDPLASKTKFCKPMKCIVLEDVILYLPLFKTSLLAFTFLQCAIAALSAFGRSGQSSDAPKSAAFTGFGGEDFKFFCARWNRRGCGAGFHVRS